MTSDTLGVVDEAIVEFGYNTIVGSKDVGIHLDLHEQLDDEECLTLGYVFIDFFLLGSCDMAVISHSGFGLIGILNKPDKNFDDIYVYTSPRIMGKEFWKRNEYQLDFYKYDSNINY